MDSPPGFSTSADASVTRAPRVIINVSLFSPIPSTRRRRAWYSAGFGIFYFIFLPGPSNTSTALTNDDICVPG